MIGRNEPTRMRQRRNHGDQRIVHAVRIVVQIPILIAILILMQGNTAAKAAREKVRLGRRRREESDIEHWKPDRSERECDFSLGVSAQWQQRHATRE
jgi:hypothetical protein